MPFGYGPMMGWYNDSLYNGTCGYYRYGMMGGWNWIDMLVWLIVATVIFSLIFWYTYTLIKKDGDEHGRKKRRS